jgi:hypothetical protein
MLFSSTGMLQFRGITTQKRFIPHAALEIGAIPQPIPFNTDLAKRGVELFLRHQRLHPRCPVCFRYLLHAPKISLKQYFLRRLTRLEPPYLLSFIVWAAVQFVVAYRSFSNMAPHLAASSVYLHNLIFGGGPRRRECCRMISRGRGPVLCASPALVDVICHRRRARAAV